MTCRRRSSAGGPRRCRARATRSTSSEAPLNFDGLPVVVATARLGVSPDVCPPCLLSIHRLRETVSTEHSSLKAKELNDMPKASHGYGGKFGVQEDRMDKVGVRVSVCQKGFPKMQCWWSLSD